MYFKFLFSFAIIASMYFISANAAPCPFLIKNAVPPTDAPTWGTLVQGTIQNSVCMVSSGLQTGADMVRALGSAISDASSAAYGKFKDIAIGKTVVDKVSKGTDYVKSAGKGAYDTIRQVLNNLSYSTKLMF